MTFYPGRDGDTARGAWPVTRAWVDRDYLDAADPSLDIAFVQLGDVDGHTAQDHLGAQGIDFSPDRSTAGSAGGDESRGLDVTVLGYPSAEPFDGTTLRRCTTSSAAQLDDAHLDLACRMTAGSSGGPWLGRFDTDRGAGTVIAVTSGSLDDHLDTIAGVQLTDRAESLYSEADAAAQDADQSAAE